MRGFGAFVHLVQYLLLTTDVLIFGSGRRLAKSTFRTRLAQLLLLAVLKIPALKNLRLPLMRSIPKIDLTGDLMRVSALSLNLPKHWFDEKNK